MPHSNLYISSSSSSMSLSQCLITASSLISRNFMPPFGISFVRRVFDKIPTVRTGVERGWLRTVASRCRPIIKVDRLFVVLWLLLEYSLYVMNLTFISEAECKRNWRVCRSMVERLDLLCCFTYFHSWFENL